MSVFCVSLVFMHPKNNPRIHWMFAVSFTCPLWAVEQICRKDAPPFGRREDLQRQRTLVIVPDSAKKRMAGGHPLYN